MRSSFPSRIHYSLGRGQYRRVPNTRGEQAPLRGHSLLWCPHHSGCGRFSQQAERGNKANLYEKAVFLLSLNIDSGLEFGASCPSPGSTPGAPDIHLPQTHVARRKHTASWFPAFSAELSKVMHSSRRHRKQLSSLFSVLIIFSR